MKSFAVLPVFHWQIQTLQQHSVFFFLFSVYRLPSTFYHLHNGGNMFEQELKKIGLRNNLSFEKNRKIFGHTANHLELIYDDTPSCAIKISLRMFTGRLPDAPHEEFKKFASRKNLSYSAASLQIPDAFTVEYALNYGYARQLESLFNPPTDRELREIEILLLTLREFVSNYEFSHYQAQLMCESCGKKEVEMPTLVQNMPRLICPDCIKILDAQLAAEKEAAEKMPADIKKAGILGGASALISALLWIVVCFAAENRLKLIYLPAGYSAGFIIGMYTMKGAKKDAKRLKFVPPALAFTALYSGWLLFWLSNAATTSGQAFLSAIYHPSRPAFTLLIYVISIGGACHGYFNYKWRTEEGKREMEDGKR